MASLSNAGAPREAGSYYDMHALTAESTMVPVDLLHGCTGVGCVIDPSSDSADIPAGTRLELPLWLARALAPRGMATVDLPSFYGKKVRRKLRAGAACEDLRARCPQYYTAGAMLHSAASSAGCADESFPSFLLSTLRARYRDLLMHAPTIDGSAQASRLTALLSIEERELFNAATDAALAYERWRGGAPDTRAVLKLMRGGSIKRKWEENNENQVPNTAADAHG